jgi:hypothetical protein
MFCYCINLTKCCREQGVQGNIGQTGPQGPKGSTGVQGPMGSTGPRGSHMHRRMC